MSKLGGSIDAFRITRGSKFRLKDTEPGDTRPFRDADNPKAVEMHQESVLTLAEQQDMLYAQDRWGSAAHFSVINREDRMHGQNYRSSCGGKRTFSLIIFCISVLFGSVTPAFAQRHLKPEQREQFRSELVDAAKHKHERWKALNNTLHKERKDLIDQTREKFEAKIESAKADRDVKRAKAYKAELDAEIKKSLPPSQKNSKRPRMPSMTCTITMWN